MAALQPSEAEFAALVAQPLLLQSPLQAVLQLLFGALRAQSAAIGELQARLGTLDAAASAAATAAAQLGSQQEEARGAADARLAALESRLHGASNVAGRQAALDEIASLIGVAVPEVAPPHASIPAHSATHPSWAPPLAGPAPDLADSFLPAGEGSTSLTPAVEGAAGVVPPPVMQPAGAPGTCGDTSGAPVEAGSGMLGGDAAAAATCENAAAACEPVTAADGERSQQPSRSGSMASRAVLAAAASTPAATDATAAAKQDQGPSPASQTSGQASRAAAAQTSVRAAPHSRSGGPSSRTSAATADGGLLPADGMDGEPEVAGEAAGGWAVSAEIQPTAAVAGGTHTPPTPLLAGPTSHHTGSSSAQPSAGAAAATSAAATRSPAIQVPSPAALFAAMQAGKAAGKATPGKAAADFAGTAQLAASSAAAAAARSASSSAPVAGQQAAATDAVAEPAPAPAAQLDAAAVEPAGAEPPAHGSEGARPKSAAGARLLEVVNLLRKRPSLKPSGLLWKLQASLAEAVTEQERLKGEVASLQEELQALRSSSTAGLERCGERIDAVEESAAAALVAAAAASEAAAAAAHGQVPGTPVAEIKVLEGRVATIDERVAAIDERVATIDERVAAIDEQVAASTRRISALEEAQELSSSAARLVRASSSGSSADTLAALQSHLLVQQQKLQAQMEALGAGIRQAVPGQVSEAVGGAASEIGRRLSERLATKQDVQALSVKVNSKVSREDVERMLRSHKVAMAPPPAAAPAADPNCPAAGMRFRCLSCDAALQPFAFAVAPGNGGASGSAGQAHTADLSYTQLPVASPARNAAQPWTAAVASGLEPAAAGLAGGLAGGEPSPSRLSVASGPAADVPAVQVPAVQPPSPRGSRPSTGAASRLGSPASWINRMSRGHASSGSAGASQAEEASSPARTRLATGSSMQDGGALLAPPALSVGGTARLQGAMPAAVDDEPAPLLGSKGSLPLEQLRGTSEFSEAGIREEPAAAAGTGAAAGEPLPAKSSLPALPHSPGGRIKAGRPATASPGRGGGGTAQRRGSPAL